MCFNYVYLSSEYYHWLNNYYYCYCKSPADQSLKERGHAQKVEETALVKWKNVSTSAVGHALANTLANQNQKWKTFFFPLLPLLLLHDFGVGGRRCFLLLPPRITFPIPLWGAIQPGRGARRSASESVANASINGVCIRGLAYLEQGWRQLQDAFSNDQRAAGGGYHHRVLLQAAHHHAADMHRAQLDVLRLHKVSKAAVEPLAVAAASSVSTRLKIKSCCCCCGDAAAMLLLLSRWSRLAWS